MGGSEMICVIFLVILQVKNIFGGIFYLPGSPVVRQQDYWLADEWLQGGGSLPEIIINRDQVSRNIPHQSSNVIIKDLSCQPGRFFRAKIHLKSSLRLPSIDRAAQSCSLRSHGRSVQIIEIPSGSFEECGVFSCGDQDLCLTLRFSRIVGLRTASDAVVTLKCHPQEALVVQNHILRLLVEDNHAEARRVSSVIEGGSQLPFQSHIGLFRRHSDGTYTDALAEGAEVLLGEDLMLRAQVKTQNGWNYTGMSDVSLARTSKSGDVLNSAILVTPEGCVNPSMRAICPEDPSFDPPLGQKFLFRAATFPEMLPDEEVILNVRVFGCLNRRDCLPTLSRCRFRTKRSIREIQSEVSRISFRVILPGMKKGGDLKQPGGHLVPIFSLGAMTLLCFACTILLGVLWRKYNQIH